MRVFLRGFLLWLECLIFLLLLHLGFDDGSFFLRRLFVLKEESKDLVANCFLKKDQAHPRWELCDCLCVFSWSFSIRLSLNSKKLCWLLVCSSLFSMFLSPKRSRETIFSNQGLMMPNNSSVPYPVPSLFASPRLFVGFSSKGFTDSETSMSPTSPLETKHFSTIDHHRRSPPIGLGLADILHSETQTDRKSFLQFGSQLKIQVPCVQSNSLVPSPQSPIEFGVKTKDSQLALHSPFSVPASPLPSFSPELLTDMELSEDYTCVISHGPNPKTTHIFDNCIVESCGGNGVVALRKEKCSADGFLSFCYGCKKNLSQGKDIFMYRLVVFWPWTFVHQYEYNFG